MAEEKENKKEEKKEKEESSKEDKKEEKKEDDKKEEKEEDKKEKKEEGKKENDEDEEEEEVEVPEEFEDIVEKIEEMSVVELSDLVSILEKKFNVSAVAPAAGGNGGGGGEEKSEYDVVLKEVGDQKINVIKEVKKITGLGLKEAKGLVDEAPSPIKEGVSKDDAEEMKSQLQDVGATISLE